MTDGAADRGLTAVTARSASRARKFAADVTRTGVPVLSASISKALQRPLARILPSPLISGRIEVLRACAGLSMVRLLKGAELMKLLLWCVFLISAWISTASADEWRPASAYLSIGCEGAKDQAMCEQTQKTWARSYNGALAGDITGQRNLAYCFSTGCDGAILSNRIAGCAWAVVVLRYGHLDVRELDLDIAKLYCGKQLDDLGRVAADALAARILTMLNQQK